MKGPVQAGTKHPRPAKGTNGPMDKGRSSGTKHYAPPMPKPRRTGMK